MSAPTPSLVRARSYLPSSPIPEVILIFPTLPLKKKKDPTKKSGVRWAGDVQFEAAAAVASYITPVPGGVGPMTVAMLLDNTVLSARRWFEESRKRTVAPLPLQLLTPVPSDIDIATAQRPKNIKQVVEELGLSGSEVSGAETNIRLECEDRL